MLDIGANIGAFCIRAARFSPHVTAVEPVTADLLEENVRLNHADVQDHPGRLAPVHRRDIVGRVPSDISHVHARKPHCMAEGCDFLKCDCEGAEWLIQPRDLDGIRKDRDGTAHPAYQRASESCTAGLYRGPVHVLYRPLSGIFPPWSDGNPARDTEVKLQD